MWKISRAQSFRLNFSIDTGPLLDRKSCVATQLTDQLTLKICKGKDTARPSITVPDRLSPRNYSGKHSSTRNNYLN